MTAAAAELATITLKGLVRGAITGIPDDSGLGGSLDGRFDFSPFECEINRLVLRAYWCNVYLHFVGQQE